MPYNLCVGGREISQTSHLPVLGVWGGGLCLNGPWVTVFLKRSSTPGGGWNACHPHAHLTLSNLVFPKCRWRSPACLKSSLVRMELRFALTSAFRVRLWLSLGTCPEPRGRGCPGSLRTKPSGCPPQGGTRREASLGQSSAPGWGDGERSRWQLGRGRGASLALPWGMRCSQGEPACS